MQGLSSAHGGEKHKKVLACHGQREQGVCKAMVGRANCSPAAGPSAPSAAISSVCSWDTPALAGSRCHGGGIGSRGTNTLVPSPHHTAGHTGHPQPTSATPGDTDRCHHREERHRRAPTTGAHLPSFGRELCFKASFCISEGFLHPPACWVSATCPRWVTGTRAAAPGTRRAPGDSSPPNCSGRCRGTASACALWIGPAPCRPSGARRTCGLQQTPSVPALHPQQRGREGTLLGWFLGMGKGSQPPDPAHPSRR